MHHEKNNKIVIGISLTLLFIGVVHATNNNELFTAPSGLQPMGHDDFLDTMGHNIMILELSDDNKQTWFENDTDQNYLVQKYNDTCYIGVDDENNCYILEIVEKDNTKYIIGSWTPKGAGETPTIQKNLEAFNKLNKLTPLLIEEQ